MAKNYTAEQVVDMIIKDDIGEMDSADSLDEESGSSSSNDEPSSQSEVDSSSNTDSEFHGRQVLIEKRSVRNHPSSYPTTIRTRGGISNHGRTIRTRRDISNHGKRTVMTRGRVQNCRTRDAAHTSHSQLNKTMGNNAGHHSTCRSSLSFQLADLLSLYIFFPCFNAGNHLGVKTSFP